MVRHWLNRMWLPLLLVMGGILLVWAFPYLVSAYHLEIGGWAIDGLESPAQNPSPALEHLQKAIRRDPQNAQAYRLLGRVYRAQRDWPAAVDALTCYTVLRPDNPLGHLELAEIYKEIESEMAAMHVADLVALLPQAQVKAPSVPLDTPYGQPDGPTWHSYVAETVFSLPPGLAARPTLFMHSPSWVTYTLLLPPQPAVLRFGMGMDPQTHDWPGDGVTFEVLLNGERIFLEHVDKAMARQGWHERTVDLAPWAGQEVALGLGVTPGPVGDTTGDWAGWAALQVVDAQMIDLATLHPGTERASEWRRAGFTAEALVNLGQAAQVEGRDEKAGEWYELATRLEPGRDEPYRLLRGISNGDEVVFTLLTQGGLDALERAERLRPGDLYLNHLLFKGAQGSGDLAAAAVYSETLTSFPLEAIDPSDDRLLEYVAQVVPGLLDEGLWDGETMLNVVAYIVSQHKDAPGAGLLIRNLMEQDTAPSDLGFYLGELYYGQGNLGRAEMAYQQVLARDPAYKQAYLQLGRVNESQSRESSDQQHLAEAARWYGQYHALAPNDLLGLKELTEVCSALEEAGAQNASCHQTAERVLASDYGGEAATSKAQLETKPAMVLQETLATRTDDRRVVAEMLGVSVDAVELGPNLVENGGFEDWVEESPRQWTWLAHFNQEPFNEAAFAGSVEELFSFEGQRATRVDGFWVQRQDDKSSARAGFWYGDEQPNIVLEPGVPYVLSVYYSTTGISNSKGATVWVSGDPDVLWANDHRLPATDGMWWCLFAVGWNRSDAEAKIRPLLRSYATGNVKFDDIQIRPIRLTEGVTVSAGEAEFRVIGQDD
jgi:tetratricopeptide (TPR) repeat protein